MPVSVRRAPAGSSPVANDGVPVPWRVNADEEIAVGTHEYALSRGRHVSPDRGRCAMEWVAQLTGERQDLPTAALAQIVLPIDQWRDLKRSTRGTLVGLWLPEELT